MSKLKIVLYGTFSCKKMYKMVKHSTLCRNVVVSAPWPPVFDAPELSQILHDCSVNTANFNSKEISSSNVFLMYVTLRKRKKFHLTGNNDGSGMPELGRGGAESCSPNFLLVHCIIQ